MTAAIQWKGDIIQLLICRKTMGGTNGQAKQTWDTGKQLAKMATDSIKEKAASPLSVIIRGTTFSQGFINQHIITVVIKRIAD